MRFERNGYPGEYIRAFEYNTTATGALLAAAGGQSGPLDSYIDDLLEELGEDQVYLACHSLGTRVCGHYLGDAVRAEKVAGYVAIDGQPSETCPGDVPCMAVAVAETRFVGDNNLLLADEAHVQVATSAASFAGQFAFFTGVEPATTSITREEGMVSISGRAANFPANSGADESTLQVWEIDSSTGMRIESTPLAVFDNLTNGHWGPVELQSDAHYEFNLLRPGRTDHHFYFQPFARSSNLVRLNTSPAGSDIELNTHVSGDHVAVVVQRDKEWWTTHASGNNDVLRVSSSSLLWGDQAPADALHIDMGNSNIALHLHDDEATPAISSGDLLPYFNAQPFQTGTDIYMPASNPLDGTVTLINHPRGDESRAQEINVPNWPSTDHKLSITFNDYLQD